MNRVRECGLGMMGGREGDGWREGSGEEERGPGGACSLLVCRLNNCHSPKLPRGGFLLHVWESIPVMPLHSYKLKEEMTPISSAWKMLVKPSGPCGAPGHRSLSVFPVSHL